MSSRTRKDQLIGMYKILYSVANIKEKHELALDYKLKLIDLIATDEHVLPLAPDDIPF